MGTINYHTSEYITLGIRPYEKMDFENDESFMDEIRHEVEEYGGTVDEAIDTYITDCYDDDYANVEAEIDDHDFQYFDISIKPGYYEGFTINIERNFPDAYETWEDKRDAQKEITEIRKMLLNCAGNGLVKCSPGWVTGYSDYNETVSAIDEAIREMRKDVKTTPTWTQLDRGNR